MKPFWSTLLFLIALITGFNFWMDVAHRWHRLPRYFTQHWSAKECWVAPEDFDERKFRSRDLAVLPQPDVVLIGSSTVLAVNSDPLRPGLKFYNAAVSAATLSDYIFIWQRLKEERKIPRRIILAIDPLLFTDGEENFRTENRESLKAYARFIRPYLAEPNVFKAWIGAVWRVATSWGNEVSELLSWQVTTKSVSMFLTAPSRELATLEAQYGVVPLDTRPVELTAYSSDGARLFSAKMAKPKSREEIRKLGVEYAHGNHWAVALMLAGERKIPGKLLRLMTEMRDHGVEVLVFLPPIQPDALEGLREREETRVALSDDERLAAKLAHDFGSPLCDRIDAKQYCQPTEFYDPTHMFRPCANRVLRSCLAGIAAWSGLLKDPTSRYN